MDINMKEELLLLVDNGDNVVGYGEKMDIHLKGNLHRAFSIFIIDPDENKMLLQRRAYGKYHSGGLWSNACCSHPKKGEEIQATIIRRVKEELGVKLDCIDSKSLRKLGKFEYYKSFGKYTEHEIDHVFISQIRCKNLSLAPDKKEVSEIKWVEITELINWIKERPNDFTVWFPNAFNLVLKENKYRMRL